MDSRIYFHQYRRPRYNNPTYMSSNVNSSLTFFDDKVNKNPHYNHFSQQIDSFSMQDEQIKNRSFLFDKEKSNNIKDRYNTINNSSLDVYSNNYNGDRYLRGVSHDRNPSNLSSYGSNSLTLNQNDIYNKQNTKFNIITMQPKEFDISIRQHPKYTLENKDELYYKRMTEELNKKKMYEESYNDKRLGMNILNNSGGINGDLIAGKHTYGHEKEKQTAKVSAPEQSFTINPQTVTNQYKLSQASFGNGKDAKNFNPKLLSQMDELISLS